MARPRSISPRDLAPLLRSRGPVSAIELSVALGVNRSTVVRGLALFGEELVSMGKTRRTRYALRRDIGAYGNAWPVYRIDESGRAEKWLQLESLHDRLWRVQWAGEAPAWARHFANAEGLWNGFPFFLGDVRPQGFLGRALAQRLSLTHQLAADPRNWSDDDIMVFLQSAGADLPGHHVVGDVCLRQALGHAVHREADSRDRYPELTSLASQGTVGSSAGGEQPKFLASLREADSWRHVLVKYSPPMDQAVGRRWADLLLAEYHAHEVLAEHGHGMAGVKCFDLEGRRFLEVPRFDRSPASGRRGVVSLHVLHAAGVGSHARTWVDALKELNQEGLVDDGTLETGARLQSFGELIGNTDMHFGNLALWMSDDLPFRLAPVYDMLPMLWAPSAQGELVNRRHAPEPPIPAMRDAWHEAAEWADQFWGNLASDQRLSKEFICFAEQAIETLTRLRGVGKKS